MIRAIPFAALSVAALLTGLAGAEDPPKKVDPDDEIHHKAAEKVVAALEVEAPAGEKWEKVKRHEKPLLYYGDPTREHDRGSVWAWGDKGRPAVLMELFQDTSDRDLWVFVLCNTSGGKVRASVNGREWWKENESAAELKDIPGAPEPAADAVGRQRQLKALAGKFTGHEFWDPNNSRFELRRLDRPLHSYRDDSVLDGALYTLANGTNPELMLFIEARAGKEGAKPTWQFTTGRLAHAELHLLYDGKAVFEAPRGTRISGSNKPYWLGFMAAAKVEK